MRKSVILAIILLIGIWILNPVGGLRYVNAEEIEQSPDVVSIELHHEHSSQNCYEQVWVPCGGHWCTNFEPYEMATVYYCSNAFSTQVVNGVQLSSIHISWVCNEMHGIHAGEYVNNCICNKDVIGTFSVTQQIDGTSVTLVAAIESDAIDVSDYSIHWNRGAVDPNDPAKIAVSENGVYTATIDWYDEQAGEWRQNSIEYMELSVPIHVRYMDAEACITEISIHYGDILADISVPIKAGYSFLGYYKETQIIHDANGFVVPEVDTKWEVQDIVLEAKWEPKHYILYYGGDYNEDGIPDDCMEVIFGENYSSIDPPSTSNGRIFDGYYINGERVFDATGNPTGFWKWDFEGELVLLEQWITPIDSVNGDNSSENSEGNTQTVNTQLINTQVDNSISSNNSQSQNNVITAEAAIMENIQATEEISDSNIGTEPITNSISISNNANHIESNQSNEAKNEITNEETNEETISEDSLPIYMASADESIPQEILSKQSKTFNTIMRVGAITAGCMAVIIGGISMWLYYYALATVQTTQLSKKRIVLGKVMLNERGNHIQIGIGKKIIDKCNTNQLQIQIPKWYVKIHHNKELIIHLPEKKISEYVRPNILIQI